MHTIKIGDHKFHYDGDFHGTVTIVAPNGLQVPLPVKVLMEFAAEVVRSVKTTQLERATTEELLGLK